MQRKIFNIDRQNGKIIQNGDDNVGEQYNCNVPGACVFVDPVPAGRFRPAAAPRQAAPQPARRPLPVGDLYAAAKRGDFSYVERCLSAGAYVETTGPSGCTLLYVAAQEGHTAVVELLLQYRANINALDVKGRNPLTIAERKGHHGIVQLLQNAAWGHYP